MQIIHFLCKHHIRSEVFLEMFNERHDQVLLKRCQELLSGSDGKKFCDITLVHGHDKENVILTSKIFIFLQYPYLVDAVLSCDLGKGSFQGLTPLIDVKDISICLFYFILT